MQIINKKRVLFIPDLYEGMGSGAIVTQVLVRLFKECGFSIAVMSSEFAEKKYVDNVICYPCRSFCGTANILSKEYLTAFRAILDEFQPTHLFFDGSITNKPLCYLEEGLKRKLDISVFIFMQDFFCSKYYANNNNAPCIKCLEDGFLSAFSSDCNVRNIGYVKLAERCRTRYKLRKILSKVNHVGTSTDEQLGFYSKFGIPNDVTFKLPLPFDDSKLNNLETSRGNYIVGIAQNRIEKGFHFIPEILQHTKSKIVLAYYNEKELRLNTNNPKLKPFVDNGQLSMVVASWKTGLGKLIANSNGVIIPTIWPTTTEFGWLEALALRKPTITFNIGAHKEFLINRYNGLTSPLGDFKAMGDNIDYLSFIDDKKYNIMVDNIDTLYRRLTDWCGWRLFINKL